jgi:hypothetical protein
MGRLPAFKLSESVGKIMKAKESSQPVVLNTHHLAVWITSGAGRSGFSIAPESLLVHQPAEDALQHLVATHALKPLAARDRHWPVCNFYVTV